MIANVITEYAYLFKHQFSSVTFFILYVVTCAIKVLLPFLIILISLRRNVIGKLPKAFTYDID